MLKNLKKLFVCFLVLLFSSVSIVNISTVASFFDYPSDGDDYDYEDSSGEPLDLDAFFSESSDDFSEHSGLYEENYEEQTKTPLDWEALCTKISKLSGEEIPHDSGEQQLMVCRNLYLLFNIYNIEETKRDLKDIFSLLRENDKDLSCKISRILEKSSQRDFYNLYQRFMAKLQIRAKDRKNVSKVDALLLLSYAYLYQNEKIPGKSIFNSSDMAALKSLLNDIFSDTVYSEILHPSVPPILDF